MIYATMLPRSLIQSPLRTVETPSLFSFFSRALVCFFHACFSRLTAIKGKKIHEIGGTWTASCPVLLLLGTLYLGHILQYQWLAKSCRGSTISDPMPGHGLILDSHTCWKNTQGTECVKPRAQQDCGGRTLAFSYLGWLNCKAQDISHPVLGMGYGKHSWSCTSGSDLVYLDAKTRI